MVTVVTLVTMPTPQTFLVSPGSAVTGRILVTVSPPTSTGTMPSVNPDASVTTPALVPLEAQRPQTA